MMNFNVAIGIITYNPEESVVKRLSDTVKSGYKVYVFDNSPDNSIIRDYVHSDDEARSHITYLTCGKNAGLGFGLSAVCAQAYYDAFPALLFFDQDTVYSTETLDYISAFYGRNESLAVSYSSVVFNSKSVDDSGNLTDPQAVGDTIKDVRLAINSGSLYFLNNLKKMNWHSTKYFVDCVDYEFNLSSSNHHFKIGEHSATPGFDHCSEQGDTRYKVFGVVLPMRAYRFSRIKDTYCASTKLFWKALVTGNLTYSVEFSKSIHKYLFVQFYVRLAKLFHVKGC